MDKKTRALTGPRQLKLMAPEYIGSYTLPDGWAPYKTWRVVDNNVLYFEGKIDVNLSLDSLTMFPQAVLLQDPGVYIRTPSPIPDDPANDLLVLDIVSTKQLDVSAVWNDMNTLQNAPGMLESFDDFNQIIMGTFRYMAQNTQLTTSLGVQTTMEAKDFSSASPFAQDFLWCYRILIPRASELEAMALSIPASRFIVQVVVGQENEIPYMMRLKNSYELQQL